MNPRERILAIAVVALVVVAGLSVAFYQFYMSPLKAKQDTLKTLHAQEQTKQEQVNKIVGQRVVLERFRQESLPAELDVAKRKYTEFLTQLLQTNGFRNVNVTSRANQSRSAPTLTNKTPIYTPLGFAVSGNANLENLVTMMESFYRKGLLHQIKTLDIKRPLTLQQNQRQDDLDVTMSIEALVVTGSDKRSTLMPAIDGRLAWADAATALQGGSTGLGIALWTAGPFGPHGPTVLAQPDRDYSAMAAKNIFFGPPRSAVAAAPVLQLEDLRYTILTDITWDRLKNRRWASLYDQANQGAKDHSTLKTLGGFNEFSLLRTNQAITLVHGEVLRIDAQSLVFRVALNAEDPEDKAPHYKDRERIYKLHPSEIEGLTRDGLSRTEDTSRLFWVDKGRWDFLVADKMVTVNGRMFAFKWDLVKGFVIREDVNGVIIRLDEKYCAYRYEKGPPRSAHEGYCLLKIGGNVADALATPLKENEIKQLLAAH
jgi:hypothetical protein